MESVLDEAVVHGEDGELETREDAGLVEDARQVVLHGVLPHAERFTDLLVGFTGSDARDYFELARGQAVLVARSRPRLGAVGVAVGVDHLARGIAAEPVLFLGDRADALEEQRGRRA